MADHLDGTPDPLSSQPIPKTPFLPSDRFSIRRIGSTENHDLTVYFFHDVIEELIYTARFQPALVTAGFLTGGYYSGPAGRYVELRGFQDSAVIDKEQAVFAFSRRLWRDWARQHQERKLRDSGLVPLGWFLSKPDCHGKPGPYELICHLTYFNLPYHLCLLLDPLEQVLGLYRQVREGYLENIGFNLIETISTREDKNHEDHRHTST